MPHEAKMYFWDIYDNATFAIEDLANHSLTDFRSDRRLRASTVQHLIIVGEACRRLRDLDPAVARKLPGNDNAVGMRNILAHEYSEIDYELVWETVGQHLVVLRDRALELNEESN